MRKRLIASIPILLLSAQLLTCTEASIEGLPPPPPPDVDNKVSVSGKVCMQRPEDLIFPVRVVFLVDCSESMEIIDPPDPETGETGRERAVREAAENLLTGEGDVKMSVVRFSSQSQPITAEMKDDGTVQSYFTDDLERVLANLSRLAETDRTTNYLRALSEAYAEIRDELTSAEQESLALSSYHVIMVTDGIPDIEGSETRENSSDNIIDSVKSIMDLGQRYHVGKITVNTAFISSGNAAVDLEAGNLLQLMAEEGAGTYRSFISGGELNFVYINLTALKRVFTLQSLVVENINAIVTESELLADSDGDGMADEVEIVTKSNPFDPDSDGDGCRDGMEYRFRSSGMDPIDPEDCQCFIADYCFDENENGLCDCFAGDEDTDPPPEEGSCCVDEDGDHLCDCIDKDDNGICDASNYSDGDGDGLNDCEERYTGTNRNGADTDGDGIIDFIEIRFGTSPDIHDIADDLDWDAVPNGEEIRTATDPNASTVVSGRSKLAYRYTVNELPDINKGSTCYEFEVTNISLVEIIDGKKSDRVRGPAGQGYSGSNRILVLAGEVPFDDPESFARYRVACVEGRFQRDGNFKNPPDGRLKVTNKDFVALDKFKADKHCKPPGGR